MVGTGTGGVVIASAVVLERGVGTIVGVLGATGVVIVAE